MASKGLKFIVTDAKGAPGVSIVDKALFDQGSKKLADALRTHDITKPKGALNTYGTAVLVNILNEAGGYPTRNFYSGRFKGAAKTSGEFIFEGNKKRLGKDLMKDESGRSSAAGDHDLVGRHYDEIFELEVSRLERWSPVEYRITLRYLGRYLPDGAVVAEVGVGGGLYSEYMLRRGCRSGLSLPNTLPRAASIRSMPRLSVTLT